MVAEADGFSSFNLDEIGVGWGGGEEVAFHFFFLNLNFKFFLCRHCCSYTRQCCDSDATV